MKREFLIERQGKSFVLYAGLLDAAHQKGLIGIATKLVQSPTPENGFIAIVSAEVVLKDENGVERCFGAIGDACPENVGRMVAAHYIRMAETRAKARALRDAINVGTAAVEELTDLDDDGPAVPVRTGPQPQARPSPVGAASAPTPLGQRVDQARPAGAPTPLPVRSGNADPRGDVATPAQVRAIYMIAREQHGMAEAAVDQHARDLYGSSPAELTKRQASNLIDALKSAAEPAASS